MMFRLAAICWLFFVAGIPALAKTASPQESTSRAAPDVPTPPDAPTPDLGQQTSVPPKSKAKKIANKFDPHCIDVIFHSCWSSPVAPQGKQLTEEEQKAQQAAKDIDVGYYYLNEKNYIAAESRLREAVELQPDAAAAWVGLAQAQQKLHKDEAARQSYETYLKLNPDSAGADQAKKALASLQPAVH
jgi:tetratricopeptide (TPR) repeat protein